MRPNINMCQKHFSPISDTELDRAFEDKRITERIEDDELSKEGEGSCEVAGEKC